MKNKPATTIVLMLCKYISSTELIFGNMRFFYSLIVLILITLYGYELDAQNADINMLKKINVERNKNLDGTMKFVSNTEGYIGVGIPVSVCIAAIVTRDKQLLEKGVNMSLALAANSITTYALKRIINRDRPAVTYPYLQAFETEKHYSFPSGHTSNAFCTATSLSLNFKKWYVVVPAYMWACGVGYSRMHLGMHYPSDVFAGALVGAGSALLTYKANQWIKKYYIAKYSSKTQL